MSNQAPIKYLYHIVNIFHISILFFYKKVAGSLCHLLIYDEKEIESVSNPILAYYSVWSSQIQDIMVSLVSSGIIIIIKLNDINKF